MPPRDHTALIAAFALSAIALFSVVGCAPSKPAEPLRAQDGPISRESALWIAGQISSYVPGISPEISSASGSMEPTFGANSVTLWFPFNPAKTQLRPGHIVQVRRDGKPRLVHRVIGFDSAGRVITKGDANQVADEPVEISRVTHVFVGQLQFDPSF